MRSGKRELSERLRDLDRVAWFSGNSQDRPHPVGGKEPNEFGLHDMLGNVAELCADVHDPGFYVRPEAAWPDPVCSTGSRDRVVRGGSFWMNTGLQLYWSTIRSGFPEDENALPIGYVGFRAAHALPR